jgi:hypothetical protein
MSKEALSAGQRRPEKYIQKELKNRVEAARWNRTQKELAAGYCIEAAGMEPKKSLMLHSSPR